MGSKPNYCPCGSRFFAISPIIFTCAGGASSQIGGIHRLDCLSCLRQLLWDTNSHPPKMIPMWKERGQDPSVGVDYVRAAAEECRNPKDGLPYMYADEADRDGVDISVFTAGSPCGD